MKDESTKERPLVTFALFAYNQEKYIREAVEGAFSQTYEPLEIILSDDCSTDRTFEIMQEMAAAYKGPHEVRLRQNEVNFGVAGHINAVFSVARGGILVIAAGDDVSFHDRTEISVELFNKHRDATAVLLSADTIDQNGKVIGEQLASSKNSRKIRQSIEDLLRWDYVNFGATRAIRSEVFWIFGELNSECPTEDSPLLIRSLMCGYNVVSSEKGILYRKHQENLSNISSLGRMNSAAIYKQYNDDINIAEKSFIIEGLLSKKLRYWVLLDEKVREIRLKIAQGSKVGLMEFIFILKNRSFSLRYKVKILVKNVF
jgi:glycosyltransferase involved in cell wall biosynthesis